MNDIDKTQLILKYCRLVDGNNIRKEHAKWCECLHDNGRWPCDCGRQDALDDAWWIYYQIRSIG